MSATNGHTNGFHSRNGVETTNIKWAPGQPRCGRNTWTAWAPVGIFEHTPGNPAERCDPTSRKYSMARMGEGIKLANGPILSCTAAGKPGQKRFTLYDANRRVACSRYWLGLDFLVLTMIIEGPFNEEVFAIVNDVAPARTIRAADKVKQFNTHPKLLGPVNRANLQRMKDVLGQKLMLKAGDRDASYPMFRQAEKVAFKCDSLTASFIAMCFEWIVDYNLSGVVEQQIIRNKRVKADALLQIITANKPFCSC